MSKGEISVQTQHIFPVIKKWLYSDKDIFLRELVSNASDAVVKLKHLSAIGEATGIDDDFKITVTLDREANTITVSDNGIGMSEAEVDKYINQIALSGALDFIQKYEGEPNEKNADGSRKESAVDGIIGHFGLGFYSAFMIADTVEIITKSYTDAPAVHWSCTDDGEYNLEAGNREGRGSDIILHVAEGECEYLNKSKIEEILSKYCSFIPVPLYLDEIKKAEDKKDDIKEDLKPVRINEEDPLWLKAPNQCTEEEYEEFYKKVFFDYKKPLFHIHINADYPLNFKGILYFPKINHEYESIEGQVKLYYNRVFVADNIKEVIPDYLLMLKGVLDCPELPLNVSRSYLQSNTYVKKLSDHIVKKVCDKINSMFNTDRDALEKIYDDIMPFIEYACMRDQKFYDRVKNSLLYKTVDGDWVTLNEYLTTADIAEEKKDDKEEVKKVFYASDVTRQAVYVNMFKAADKKIIILDKLMDNQFISMLENTEKNVKFMRIDANTDAIKETDGEPKSSEDLEKLFREISGNDKLTVSLVALKDKKIPAIMNISEESRRFNEMMKFYSMYSPDGTGAKSLQEEATLVLNSANGLIERLSKQDGFASDVSASVAKQIYTLALLGQRQLTADELSDFLDNSIGLLEKI